LHPTKSDIKAHAGAGGFAQKVEMIVTFEKTYQK